MTALLKLVSFCWFLPYLTPLSLTWSPSVFSSRFGPHHIKIIVNFQKTLICLISGLQFFKRRVDDGALVDLAVSFRSCGWLLLGMRRLHWENMDQRYSQQMHKNRGLG